MSDERNNEHAHTVRFRLWRWFIIGFVVTWTGLALAIDAYSLASDGGRFIACKLWRFYIIEAQRAFHDTGAIGPGTGHAAAAAIIFIQHTLLAAVGGTAGLAAAGGVSAYCRFTRHK